MKQRVITALIALGIFLPILFVGDIWLRTLLAMLAIVAIYEFFQMKKMNIFSIFTKNDSLSFKEIQYE